MDLLACCRHIVRKKVTAYIFICIFAVSKWLEATAAARFSARDAYPHLLWEIA